MKRDLEQLFKRRRTVKHTIRVLMSTAHSAHDNSDRVAELERQLTELEAEIKAERRAQK